MNKENFEFHRSIVDWMTSNGITFMQAMIIVSYAEESQKCIPRAYVDLNLDDDLKDKCQEDEKIT